MTQHRFDDMSFRINYSDGKTASRQRNHHLHLCSRRSPNAWLILYQSLLNQSACHSKPLRSSQIFWTIFCFSHLSSYILMISDHLWLYQSVSHKALWNEASAWHRNRRTSALVSLATNLITPVPWSQPLPEDCPNCVLLGYAGPATSSQTPNPKIYDWILISRLLNHFWDENPWNNTNVLQKNLENNQQSLKLFPNHRSAKQPRKCDLENPKKLPKESWKRPTIKLNEAKKNILNSSVIQQQWWQGYPTSTP